MYKTLRDYPNYEISDSGLVRRKDTGYIMSMQLKKGYLTVSIGKDTHLLVHRLVAQTFIPNPDNLPCVNHKDENKTNNCVDNLEWCTVAYNNAYGDRQTRCDYGRSKAVIALKDGQYYKRYNSIVEAAEDIGCTPACISGVLQGLHNTTHGYGWIYETGMTNKEASGESVKTRVADNARYTPAETRQYRKAIILNEEGKEPRRFESIYAASKELGVGRKSIVEGLHRKQSKWRYA